MKKLVSLLGVALSATILLASCGGKGETKAPEESKSEAPSESAAPSENAAAAKKDPKDMNIQLVSKGFQHDFWQQVLKGSQKAAEEAGIDIKDPTKFNFQGPDSETNVQQQMTQVQTALATKPDAFCFASVNVDASMEYMTQAKNAGVPVIGFDSGVPGAPEGSVLATASTDNHNAGAMAATEMLKILGDKVKNPASQVVIGVGSQEATSESVIGRTQGFLDQVVKELGEENVAITGLDKYNKGDASKAKVVLEVCIPSSVDLAQMSAQVSPTLQKDNVIGFYASNELATKGLLNADENYNKLGKDVVGVGFDSGKIINDAVRSGKLAGAITQNPFQIGYQAVTLAIKAANGEPVKDVDTGCFFFTKDNMDQPEIAQCLYD